MEDLDGDNAPLPPTREAELEDGFAQVLTRILSLEQTTSGALLATPTYNCHGYYVFTARRCGMYQSSVPGQSMQLVASVVMNPTGQEHMIYTSMISAHNAASGGKLVGYIVGSSGVEVLIIKMAGKEALTTPLPSYLLRSRWALS